MEGGVLKPLRTSRVFPPEVMEDIQVKAELGRYRFRGFGTIRPPTKITPSYIESASASPASPHTMMMPRCIMKPVM